MARITLAAFVLLLIGLGCCDPVVEETQRVTSPDGRVDAVLTVSNPRALGATTSEAYRVYVTAKGAEPGETDERFKADKVHALRVYWEADRRLVIAYGDARIFHFSNFWQAKSIDEFQYVVNIRLE